MTRFCAVFHKDGREDSRTIPLSFDRAIAITKAENYKHGRPCAYVEEARDVKHLPVREG